MQPADRGCGKPEKVVYGADRPAGDQRQRTVQPIRQPLQDSGQIGGHDNGFRRLRDVEKRAVYVQKEREARGIFRKRAGRPAMPVQR
ncbi:hypothetical protein BG36_19170 [Aquamicrobium defluvii]|uniref:Uncharacterized protein n=1 Tax=Aquamicrobium defluvii TaxID=69279 RepID=A0A011UZ81_9HYPH|nr:hypothetical protein BG36_19170 [Aquamicrobium defluvii]EZQ13605.1 hypothetical protein CF98_27375 [Halopseudomonas bauzanensis]